MASHSSLLATFGTFLVAILISGCASYRSTYVPPDDGRAHLVLQGSKVVLAVATPPDERCMPPQDVEEVPTVSVSTSEVQRTVRVYASLGRSSGSSSAALHSGAARSARGSSGAGATAAVIVVFAAMAITAYALSLADPTASGAADTIDTANEYNDRIKDGACQ